MDLLNRIEGSKDVVALIEILLSFNPEIRRL